MRSLGRTIRFVGCVLALMGLSTALAAPDASAPLDASIAIATFDGSIAMFDGGHDDARSAPRVDAARRTTARRDASDENSTVRARRDASLDADAGLDASDADAEVDDAEADVQTDAELDADADADAEASASETEEQSFAAIEPDAGVPLKIPEPVESEAAQPLPVRERPYAIVKVLLGLVGLLGLAYVAGHPRVLRFERALGISQAITAGFPFVGLGLLASMPAVGILTEEVLGNLGPMLRLGLGWIGFVMGFRFDVKRFEQLPSGGPSLVITRIIVEFFTIVLSAALVLLGERLLKGQAFQDPTFLRDALILGTAGIVTARSTHSVTATPLPGAESSSSVTTLVRVEEFAAVLGLLVVGAYFRPAASGAWQVPGSGWLLLTLGIGAVMGILIYSTMLLKTAGIAEYNVLALGSIAFAAGMASSLRLSPVVVCFIAGALLTNLPSTNKQRFEQTLLKLERPIYFVFLMVVGALWKVSDLKGWILMLAFTIARFAGKWLATVVPSRRLKLNTQERQSLILAPMSTLSIAIVVSAGTLYPGGSISAIVTAVLGAAIVSEILVQRALRALRSNGVPSSSGGPNNNGRNDNGDRA